MLTAAIPAQAQTNGPFYPGDTSKFLEDVTHPDHSTVQRGEVITKQWKVRNTGTVDWVDRFISRRESPLTGFACEKWTPLDNTKPGESCIMSVVMVAPFVLGDVKTNVKQVELYLWTGWFWRKIRHREFYTLTPHQRANLRERVLFPNQDPAYIDVQII